MGFAQLGARFGRIDFCGLAIGPAGQKSPVNQRIDEPGNRRRRQVKMLAQLFPADDGIIIDQHHQKGVGGRQPGSPKLLIGHAGDHPCRGIGAKEKAAV
jgi:hypothetical protein